MIVDHLRAGYYGVLKPWQGSDDTIKIRWYRAAPGAKQFPLPSAFCSSVWDTAAGIPIPEVGEVQALREWAPTVLPGAPPGKEFHGAPAWWLSGIPADHRADPPANCWTGPPSWCFQLEDGSGHIVLEDGSGCVELEAGP